MDKPYQEHRGRSGKLFPIEQGNFRYVGTKWLVGGKLPQPGIIYRPEGVVFSLLPCNPRVQDKYPDFLGYLIQQTALGKVVAQVGVNYDIRETEGWRISDPKGLYGPQEVSTQATRYLIEIATAEGHNFSGLDYGPQTGF